MRGVLLLLFQFVMVAVAKERAILEIVLYEQVENGEVKTYEFELSGHFTAAGALGSAEGQIVQVHPMGLCNDGDFEESIRSYKDYGWVVVVKLELPQFDTDPCMSVYNKAKRAIQRGATAVVFDVTDNQRAAKQLRTAAGPPLARPVVIVRGKEAGRLMDIVNTQKQARARIKALSAVSGVHRSNSKEFFNMGIFLAFFVLFCIVCLTVILKLKWRQRTRQLSMSEVAKRTVAKLETRRYKCPTPRPKRSASVCSEADSGVDTCAICLEEYRDTQDLRILPCAHEFHRSCVDPWLISNRTCPLCLYNILECPADNDGSPCSTPDPTQHANTTQLPHHPSIVNNNMGHINNLNMAAAAVSMGAAPSSSSGLVYPSTSQLGYPPYHRPPPAYYPVAPARYHALGQYAGLEYNQVETIPLSAASVTFSSHGHPPPHYGLPLYSAYCRATSSPSSDVSPKTTSRGGPQRHVPPSRHGASLGIAARKSAEGAGSRAGRPGRAMRPPPPPPRPPGSQWTSSESDADVGRGGSVPATHQVVLHQVVPSAGADWDSSCSCGALSASGGSNIDCSNRSTLGSSDLPSDVSSFDSNAYRSRTPDPDPGQLVEKPALPPTLPPTHLQPTCVSSRASRPRTHHSLQRSRKQDATRDTLRHSCHGDVFKHGSVEAMLPPTLKSKLKQSKKANIVHQSAFSSDNSVSSLDTTGMSPIVSDWCPSSGSDESNDQLCSHCQGGLGAVTPSLNPLGDEVEGSSTSSSDIEDQSEPILPISASCISNIPMERRTKTTINIPKQTVQSHVTGVPSSSGNPSGLGAVSASSVPTGSSSWPVTSNRKWCPADHHQVAPHGCHTCANLRTSLSAVRQSMQRTDKGHMTGRSGRRNQTKTSTVPATGEATRDSVVRRGSMVLFTESEGTCITIPLDKNQDFSCLSVV